MNLVTDLLSSAFNKVHNIFFLSKTEKKLYQDFWREKDEVMGEKDILLVQCVEDYFYYGLFAKAIKSIEAKKKIQVEQYVVRSLTLGSSVSIRNFFISIFFANSFRDNKWIKLYSSYCDDIAYRHEEKTPFLFTFQSWFQAYKIFKNLKNKEELLSLKIENILVGDLIYDSYIRYKPAPTVDIKDFYLCIVIWQAIKNIYLANKYFQNKKPAILLTSYSTYIHHGIAVRIALRYGTKVYSFANNQTPTKELTLDDWYHTPKYRYYKESFDALKDKKEHLEHSRIALENRLRGKKDIATSYMKESAYKKVDGIDVPDIKDNIVIFLHDFFDSPHVYGNMVFCDFLEWVEFTIELLEKNNIPYCLKPHPNQIGDSAKVIKDLKVKYPNSNFISPKISNIQLIEAGMKVGLSVHGTVGHELVYMGIPIILSGNNLHSSYDFCYEAQNKDEYSELILQYKQLSVNENFRNEIESFYYMNNNNQSKETQQIMSNIILLRDFSAHSVLEKRYEDYIILAKTLDNEAIL